MKIMKSWKVIFCAVFSIQFWFCVPHNPQLIEADAVSVKVNTSHIMHRLDPRFYSLGLSCKLASRTRTLPFSSKRFKQLTGELAPGILRLGGTACGCVLFDEDDAGQLPKSCKPFRLSQNRWIALNEFADATGFDFLFDLNAVVRGDEDWNSTNAEMLFDFNEKQGYNVMWELGNEPHGYYRHFGVNLTSQQIAKDFVKLRNILDGRPFYKGAFVVGPDVFASSVGNGFLKGILENIKGTLNTTTFHVYPVRSVPLVEILLSPDTLDIIMTVSKDAKEVAEETLSPERQAVWLGETGTIPGGRSYEVGKNTFAFSLFMMDKLGVTARTGVQLLVRQTYTSGSRGLLNMTYIEPNIDYWQAVVYKRLVGPKVLHISTSSAGSTLKKLRLYAHCTNTKSLYRYPPGSVTVFGVNVDFSESYTLNLGQWEVDMFLFTPGDNRGLMSKKVALNGKVILMDPTGDKLPDLHPLPLASSDDVILPSLSYAFYVLKDANAGACCREGKT